MNQKMKMRWLGFSSFACVIIHLCLPLSNATFLRKFMLASDMALCCIEWTNTAINKHHDSTPRIVGTLKLTRWDILSTIVDVIILLGLCIRTYGFVWGSAKQYGLCVTERVVVGQFFNNHLGSFYQHLRTIHWQYHYSIKIYHFTSHIYINYYNV